MTPGPLAERAHTEQEFRSGTRSRALGHFCTQEWAASPARVSQVVGEAGGLCHPSRLSMPEERPWQLAREPATAPGGSGGRSWPAAPCLAAFSGSLGKERPCVLLWTRVTGRHTLRAGWQLPASLPFGRRQAP